MQWVSLGLTMAGVGLLLASTSNTISNSIETKNDWLRLDGRFVFSDAAVKPLTEMGKTCYLTVSFPRNAVDHLASLSFTQQFSEDRMPIQFDLTKTTAFVGTPSKVGPPVDVNALLDETLTLWVEFDPSLAPGTTVTLGLQPEPGLSASERYQFAVTAYLNSDRNAKRPAAQFLGKTTLKMNSANNLCQFLMPQDAVQP